VSPYEWDEWALAGLKGIEPYEVRQVLEGPGRRRPRAAVGPGGQPVLTIWGRTAVGRGLIVAVFHVEGFTWKVIGAREMGPGELVEFSRWEGMQDD
jgi:hypothetical protein